MTEDVPLKGQTIIIQYVIFETRGSQLLRTENQYYFAKSDGEQRIYTDADELIESDGKGIPNSYDVSFFNLYINGILQPQVNYCTVKNLLLLKTDDVLVKGTPITLQSIHASLMEYEPGSIKDYNSCYLKRIMVTFNKFL